MTVVFYTATCYLDISLEIIKVLKQIVSLHVLIEIHPGSKNLNIVQIEDLPVGRTLVSPKDLMNQEQYQAIEPYLSGAASVHFVVHPGGGIMSFIKASFDLFKFIRNLNPDILHLEALLFRSSSLLPVLPYCNRLVIAVHDSVAHVGERDWKIDLLKFIYVHIPKTKRFLFYSKFSKKQFESLYGETTQSAVLKMGNYTYFSKVKYTQPREPGYLLFSGRLSKYKGLEVLINAMNEVWTEFPEQTLIIAGKSVKGFELNHELVSGEERIIFIDEYISNDTLASLIRGSHLVICPYIEATQSGVLMTAFGLGVPVIASRVGAFPEFVRDNINGILVNAGDAGELATTLKSCLRDQSYLVMRSNIININNASLWDDNRQIFMNVYTA